MEKIATCIQGFEDIAAKELKGKKVCKGRIIFSTNPKNPRTLNNIYELFKEFKFNTIEDTTKKIIKFKLNKKIKVSCNREGNHNFKSVDVEKLASKKLRELGFQVDFKDYKDTFYIDIIDDYCFFGKLLKENLCKRDYRVKLISGTINACLAASTLKLINLKKGETFLDPLCKDGVIAIEASYLTSKSHGFGLDVYAARINAKIGKRKVNFEKYDLDWLTTKFTENSVDKITTFLPSPSKRRKSVNSLYRKFFHSVEIILKGKLAIISQKADLLEKFTDLKLIEKREVYSGNQRFFISVFEKAM
ncbi:MAG: hypothetical protein ABIB47_04010 [Candidatus Woesearchaeota archaeon]